MGNRTVNEYQVLVIGPRRGLVDVLRARQIRFSVWQEKPSSGWKDADQRVTAPFWKSPERIRQTVRKEFAATPCTHIIAGTESATYPAAIARRQLGARCSETTTALRCRDKLAMKEYLSDFGIPMTKFLAESSATDAARVFESLGHPVVRKNRKSSGGKTLQIIERETDLVLQQGNRNILEKFVAAPEASIESFINNGNIEFTNITAYHEKGFTNFVPAAFDTTLTNAIQDLNRLVIEALKIRWGMTHLEVYLTQKGLLFGEIAVRPPGGRKTVGGGIGRVKIIDRADARSTRPAGSLCRSGCLTPPSDRSGHPKYFVVPIGSQHPGRPARHDPGGPGATSHQPRA